MKTVSGIWRSMGVACAEWLDCMRLGDIVQTDKETIWMIGGHTSCKEYNKVSGPLPWTL